MKEWQQPPCVNYPTMQVVWLHKDVTDFSCCSVVLQPTYYLTESENYKGITMDSCSLWYD